MQQCSAAAALKAAGAGAHKVGSVRGIDYSNGDDTTLTVYAPDRPLRPAGLAPATEAAAPAP